MVEAPYLSQRGLQGSHHPPSCLQAGMAPPGLGVEGRAGLGRLCLDGSASPLTLSSLAGVGAPSAPSSYSSPLPG